MRDSKIERNEISSRVALRLASGRAIREVGWSLLIVGILSSGFIAWILIPSVGSSLQSNLISYANGVATYIAVEPLGSCTPASCFTFIPQELISAISSVNGVQHLYPFAINSTYFVARNFTTIVNGETVVIPRARFGVPSAVFGGPNGFPSNLIALSSGRLPKDEPAFVFQSYVPSGSNLPPSIRIGLNQEAEVVMGCYNCPTGNITTVGPYFNATGVGIISSNFLFNGIAVMWNSTFMMNLLGPKTFNETFGLSQTNYMILKVDTVSDVPVVARELNAILKSYPPFQLYYDQVFAGNAESFVTQVAPLYQVFGLISLVAVLTVTFLVSHLVAGKRSWEAGLMLTQGWDWSGITQMYISYFLLLSLTSFIFAALVSVGVSHFFTANYLVYGQAVNLTASADPFYILTGLLLALLMPLFAAWTVVRRLKRMGLDGILREY